MSRHPHRAAAFRSCPSCTSRVFRGPARVVIRNEGRAEGRRDAPGGSRVAVSRLYLDASFDDASVRNRKPFFFFGARCLSFSSSRALAATVGGRFVSGDQRIRGAAESRFASFPPEPFAAAKARRSARDRASRDVEADGAKSARRLVSMRSARSRREPTGRLDAATRAGPSRVLGRFGSITRTDARRCRRRGGTDARVEFRAGAGGAEHTHRAEHFPSGRGHEAET